MFNNDNTAWKEGAYPLFLGQEPALNDTINKTYPKIFELYKLQKSIDWSETEVRLDKDCTDMTTVPDAARELMIENLMYQWEADSVASRSIAGLFAPFVTNPELWDAWVKITEIENLHALTYSEIVRQCIPSPDEIFKRVMHNPHLQHRLHVIGEAFSELRVAGAKYVLGLITKEEAYPIVMNAVVALYCLERLQFMASFANTFGVVEATQSFMGIAYLVAKIMQDERWVHARVGEEIIRIELATERGSQWWVKNRETIKKMLDEVRNREYTFNTYLASKNWQVSGYNKKVADEWVDWNAADVYKTLGINVEFDVPSHNPLRYMDDWLNIDKFQTANQETDNVNYVLNSVIDDVTEETIFVV